MNTPVAFFTFNRLDVAERVFAEIRRARPSRLFLISDGARLDQPGEREQVAAVRAMVTNVDWSCDVQTNFADQNLGLEHRFDSAIKWIFDHCSEAIFLEDDCLPDQTFFPFCDELLERYRTDKRIGMISGDNFQFGRSRTHASYYFSRYPHIWGWATWRDRWSGFYDPKMRRWPAVRDTHGLVDMLGSRHKAAYWHRAFEGAYTGRIQTWDYQWVLANWLEGRLSITPNVNLISNIGFGPEATHTKTVTPIAGLRTQSLAFPLQHPSKIEANRVADNYSGQKCFYRRSLKHVLKDARHQLRKRLLGRKTAQPKHYRALNGLDRSLERACPEICNADTFYIEAGANDGLNQSNTYFLEEKYGARGLLIEAAPSSFERLLANRSARNIFECCALVPRDYTDQFVEMVFSNLMTTVAVDGQSDLPVSSDEHAKTGLQFLPTHLRNYRFGAIAATLQSLLTKHGVKKVDIFSLDVEGSELSVLKGVDFEAVDIARLLIECRDIDRMAAFLTPHGYALKEQLSQHDYLFVKQG